MGDLLGGVVGFCYFCKVNGRNMEKTCPRCGKVMEVSAEEVAMRGGVVVCPQCLAVFDLDGNLRTEQPQHTTRHIEEEPAREQAAPAAQNAVNEPYHYCPECGKPLPEGVKFCPYCGTSLATPTAPPSPTPQPQPKREEQPRATQAASTTSKGDKKQATKTTQWAPVMPTLHYRPHKWGSGPASVRARLVGYTVILAELAVLAYTVYQGMLINN